MVLRLSNLISQRPFQTVFSEVQLRWAPDLLRILAANYLITVVQKMCVYWYLSQRSYDLRNTMWISNAELIAAPENPLMRLSAIPKHFLVKAELYYHFNCLCEQMRLLRFAQGSPHAKRYDTTTPQIADVMFVTYHHIVVHEFGCLQHVDNRGVDCSRAIVFCQSICVISLWHTLACFSSTAAHLRSCSWVCLVGGFVFSWSTISEKCKRWPGSIYFP